MSTAPLPTRPQAALAEVWCEYRLWLLGLAALWFTLAFVAAPARVSGNSMNPTLHSGDLLLLLKYPRWVSSEFPARGDIVVFRGPPSSPYSFEPHSLLGFQWRTRPAHIKRVLARAGDKVELRGGQVWVNGVPLTEDYTLGSSVDTMPPQTLGAGEVWVMGDNRQVGGSMDSRQYGPIRVQDILGVTKTRNNSASLQSYSAAITEQP